MMPSNRLKRLAIKVKLHLPTDSKIFECSLTETNFDDYLIGKYSISAGPYYIIIKQKRKQLFELTAYNHADFTRDDLHLNVKCKSFSACLSLITKDLFDKTLKGGNENE